ncbi:hypothetical protein [Tolypothrix sp. FACHB-123]|nr:hypothetical protein [Tolypothrix sp. FACHB-123]
MSLLAGIGEISLSAFLIAIAKKLDFFYTIFYLELERSPQKKYA